MQNPTSGGPLTVAPATLPDVFATVVRRDPDAVAVVFEDTEVSYAKLDERANRLAHALIARGVGPERVVGLAVPRSIDMIVAELAVLKAGGAYLPLDPDDPAERLAYLVGDARPVCLVTTAALRDRFPAGPRLLLDDPFVQAQPATDPGRPGLKVESAAYVIYTSGSTGRPKGVLLTHTGVAKLMSTQFERFGLTSDVRVLQFASPSFDVAFWDLCLALLSGGRLVVVPADRRVAGPALTEYAMKHRTNFMILPPTLLAALPAECELPPGILLAGTERVSPELVARWARDRRMFNAYGPTEVTVNSTLGECDPDGIDGSSVPIGRPDPATDAYLLDDALRPVPPGVPGELYLAGPGLARCYVNRPDLTAERFLADPYGPPGRRMYRTGDLAARREDGRIDFLGRVDDQVKVRGYRIELGEIESVLARHPGVDQVAVVVREERLAVYVVPAEAAPAEQVAVTWDGSSLVKALRLHAESWLPAYLVPTGFVLLAELPVLTSGKLDRAALPAPDFAVLATGTAPRNAREQVLRDLYADVLGVPGVGIDDDFFSLGGDSIVSIQFVLRARAAGLVCTSRQVFELRTVAALAEAVTDLDSGPRDRPDDGTGDIPFTPILHWLVETGGAIEAFSQSIVLTTPAGATSEDLRAALRLLADKHDLLRSRLVRDEGLLRVGPRGELPDWLTVATGTSVEDEEQAAAGRLDPANGVMAQAVWFEGSRRLLLVLHHSIVDGVSWRVLPADLATAYSKKSLERTGTPFRRWALDLRAAARRPERVAEAALWRGILTGPDPALSARPLRPVDDLATVVRHTARLPAAVTEPVLTTVPAAFHAGVNDVLLTALALAVADWRPSDEPSVLIALEGHGREEQIVANSDLSSALGWFTSVFPVRIDPGDADRADALAGGPAAGLALKRVKEQLRAIPDHGIGYGLLRYLNPETARSLEGLAAPQISFNYLGRFTTRDGPFAPVAGHGILAGGFDVGMPVAPYTLEINAYVQESAAGPELGVTWAYPRDLIDDAAVAALAAGWFAALEALVAHARGPAAGGLTPSDLTLAIGQDEIDEFETEWELP